MRKGFGLPTLTVLSLCALAFTSSILSSGLHRKENAESTVKSQPIAESNSDWPMFRHDVAHTGFTQDQVIPPLVLNWTVHIEGDQRGYRGLSSLAVAGNVAYFGSFDNYVYALNAANGAEVWKYKTMGRVMSTPAAINATVYAASTDGYNGYIYALHVDDGSLRWKYGPVGEIQLSSVTVSEDTLYIGDLHDTFYALNAEDGSLKWSYHSSNSQSSPAVFAGKVYMGGKEVCALDINGTLIWRYDYYDPVNSQDEFFNTSPAVENGIVYIASGHQSGRIHALNATTGEVIWRHEIGYPAFSSPAIADGTVYIGSYTDYNVYALDAKSGFLKWKYHTNNYIDNSSPAVSDNLVYLCSSDGYLYALNVTNGFPIARYAVAQGTSPAIADGRIFISSEDGNVYCLATGDFAPTYPKAIFIYSPIEPRAHETTVVFDASDSYPNATIVEYYWDFGDGTYGQGKTTSHVFESYGNYNVTLTLFCDSGLASSQNQSVIVRDNPIATFTVSQGPLVSQATVFNASMSTPQGGTIAAYIWDFGDGNTTSTDYPLVSHTYVSPGVFNVTLSIIDSEHLDSSSSQLIWVMMPVFISISTSSSSTVLGFDVDVNGTLWDALGNSLQGEPVVLYYSVPGASTWTLITSDITDVLGSYYVTWIPPATGYFTITAQWSGNSTFSGISCTVNLSAIPYQNQHIFSVESNSTISGLAFNTTSWELSFEAEGPNGTSGYAKVNIAKSLVANSTDIRVCVDGTLTAYSISSLDNSWVLNLDYPHTTHRVVVTVPEWPSFLTLPILMIVTLLATVMRKKAGAL